jgi:transposase
MKRYYMGVDWGDRVHQVYVVDENGAKITEMKVQESPEGLAEMGRWVDEKRAEGCELWAAIEKPAGRIVDFLLDHGVSVYPVNPKAVDRVRDRFRMSQSKSDGFDAYVLAEFVRTDHGHLRVLRPNSAQGEELKLLTRDQDRLVRQNTRLLHQLKVTLKEYYPRPLEVFGDLDTQIALVSSKRIRLRRPSVSLNVSSGTALPPRNISLARGVVKSCGRNLTSPNLSFPSTS